VDLCISAPKDEAPTQGAGYDARRMPPETFEIYVDDDRYAVPTLHLVVAYDESMATTIAERLVAESPHHLGAELCLEGRRVAGLGSFAVRQLPPGAASRDPDSF
jgi:hypothetical protein